MSKYTYARKNIPDWDLYAYQDLRSTIKQFCLIAVLRKTPEEKVTEKVNEQIDLFTGEFDDIENGAEIARRYREQLHEYYTEIYAMAVNMVGTMTPYMFAQALVSPELLTDRQKQNLEKTVPVRFDVSDVIAQRAARSIYRDETGGFTQATAGNTYYNEIHKEVKSKMDQFEDIRTYKVPMGNINPRNVVESSVRFNRYLDQKKRMIENGVRLVYVPPHSNCSKRCQPYQGKVYSLTGQTEYFDGRTFPPIEDVADKKIVNGKRDPSRIYFAGLFAYNCRHTLVPYQEGQKIEHIPKEVIDRQRGLETHQRELEREVRRNKEKYDLLRIVRDEANDSKLNNQVKAARLKWLKSRQDYERFCDRHKLVIYYDRMKVTEGENLYKRTKRKKEFP